MARPGGTTLQKGETPKFGATDPSEKREEPEDQQPEAEDEPTEQEVEETAPEAEEETARGGEGAHEESAPEVSEDLVERAQEVLGLTESEARAFHPNRLEAVVEQTESRIQPQQTNTGEEEESQEGSPEESGDDKEELPDIGLDKDVFDPELVDALESFKSELEGRIDELEEKVETQPAPNPVDDQTVEEAIRDVVDDLPEPYHEVLGKGPVEEMDPETRENWDSFLTSLDRLVGRYEEKGVEKPLEDMVRIAANSEFPEVAEQVQSRAVRQKAKKRRKTARPSTAGSGGQETPETGEQAARNYVDRFMEEHGESGTGEANPDDFPSGEEMTPDHAPNQSEEELNF